MQGKHCAASQDSCFVLFLIGHKGKTPFFHVYGAYAFFLFGRWQGVKGVGGNRVFLYSPGCPRIGSEDQASLELRNLPAGIKCVCHYDWLVFF